MIADISAFDSAADLLDYPAPERLAASRAAADRALDAFPDCAGALEPLRTLLRTGRTEELQESYCEAFDNTADRALEVGWHAFGENYARGSFLVFMREHLRALGIAESGELPDHLSSVLRVAARLDDEAARVVIGDLTIPAVRKMLEGFGTKASPWRGAVVLALALLEVGTGTKEVFGV